MTATRRLAAILVADVVGYSRLMEAGEAGTLAALKERRKTILEPVIRAHGGRIVKVMGDGVLIEFASAVGAVGAALALQAKFAAANGGLPDARRILLRIGINLGDVIGEGPDIYGDGVNVAARLETLAEPGGICMGAAVRDAVTGKLPLELEDLGEVALKNLARPVRVYRTAIGTRPVDPPAAGVAASNLLSIAVLPFDNMSGVPEQDYICEGIAENVITDLSRFRDLTVIARNSSFAYKGKATRVQDIQRDLGVNYILEGSVQRAGERIRITAQLIEAASGRHIWAERYDRRLDDLFAVMDEITQLIVATLGTTYGGRLRKAAGERKPGSGPADFRAFDAFLLGMMQLNKFTRDSVARSIAHFEQAVANNPKYAKPYAKIAWAHLTNVTFGWSDDEKVSLGKARKAAAAALEADDAEAWAHWAVAGCEMFEGRHDLALAGMRRAVELNPNDADVLTDMGLFCTYAGLADEGLSYALKAMRINPHYPEYYAAQLGQIYFDARQYAKAIGTLEGIRTLRTPLMLVYLLASHAALGHEAAVGSILAGLKTDEPHSTVSYWTSPKSAPYREERDREHLALNLRKAGLPE